MKAEIRTLKSELEKHNLNLGKGKSLVNDIHTLKGKIDELNSQAEQVQRDGDYQASAKIRYS